MKEDIGGTREDGGVGGGVSFGYSIGIRRMKSLGRGLKVFCRRTFEKLEFYGGKTADTLLGIQSFC